MNRKTFWRRRGIAEVVCSGRRVALIKPERRVKVPNKTRKEGGEEEKGRGEGRKT